MLVVVCVIDVSDNDGLSERWVSISVDDLLRESGKVPVNVEVGAVVFVVLLDGGDRDAECDLASVKDFSNEAEREPFFDDDIVPCVRELSDEMERVGALRDMTADSVALTKCAKDVEYKSD